MRLAAVDLGTNSTRLLIAELDDAGRLTELERRSTVTRLGQDVDRTKRLDPVAVARVTDELSRIRELLREYAVERVVGVLTSAVRDAEDGAAFTRTVREDFRIDARQLSGETEAGLTFLGATSGRAPEERPTAVVDAGGGSTELVVGRPGVDEPLLFSASVQAGVVRQSERHLHHDPPAHEELTALADEVRELFEAAVPVTVRRSVGTLIATGGTATSCAAMALDLEVHDPELTHGHRLGLGQIEQLLSRLALMDEDERREVRGLQPQRATTIVAGCAMLAVALRTFEVSECEVSEHDILRGVLIAQAQGDL